MLNLAKENQTYIVDHVDNLPQKLALRLALFGIYKNEKITLIKKSSLKKVFLVETNSIKYTIRSDIASQIFVRCI